MAVLGIVLLVIAALLLFAGLRSKKRLQTLTGTGTSTCGDLLKVYKDVAADLGSNSLSQLVEVKGKAVAVGAPLRSPLGDTECVWYRSVVRENYREYEWTGTGDNRTRRLENKSRELSDEKSPQPFGLDDGTGIVTIDAVNADIDSPIHGIDRTVQEEGDWVRRFGLTINFGLLSLGGGEGTTGYHHEEWFIPAGQDLFVQGQARGDGTAVKITKPDGGKLVVSTRSEESLVKSATRGAIGFQIGAAIAGLAGIVFLIVGLLS